MGIQGVRESYESLLRAAEDTDSVGIAVETLTGQNYCEKQVDIGRGFGDLPGPLDPRSDTVRAPVDGEDLTDDEFWAAIERGDRIRCTDRPFVAEFDGFLVGGRPQTVVFEDGRPTFVYGSLLTPSAQYLPATNEVVRWVYGEILSRLGFPTEELYLGVLCHREPLTATERRQCYERVLDDYEKAGCWAHQVSKDPYTVFHKSKFVNTDRSENFEWLLGYWRGDRDPDATVYTWQCEACPYSDSCPESFV